MAQIKTFDDLIDCDPKLKFGELIQLFLKGNDDKIYINLQRVIKKKWRSYAEDLCTCTRIIDPTLVKYYDCYIEQIEDPCDNETLLTIVINEEDLDDQ